GKIERYLRSLPGVTQASVAGSLRRKQDTVGDFNFLVAGKSAAAIFERFNHFGGVLSWEAHGDSEGRFKLSSGMTVTVRWTLPEEWGLSLIRATGSALHLNDLETRAGKQKVPFTGKALLA